MQLNVARKSWGAGNQKWLGSAHGTNNARTVTIDGATIADFGGVIPAGTPLKEAEGGKYAPVAAAEDVLAGFVLTNQSATADTDVIAPMVWHGRIRADYLPEDAFDVTTLTAANPQFTIEKEG